MSNFIDVLTSEVKNEAIPEQYDYFGKLIGSWKIDYVDNSDSLIRKGEWHFARVLDGMAVQDVIVLPEFEFGTTLRVFNISTKAWDVAYCYTGKIIRLEARKENGKIVLTNLEDGNRKWVFQNIDDASFHWQDITVSNDGAWHAKFDIFAERYRE